MPSATPRSSKPTESDAPLPLFNWLAQRGAGLLLHPTAFPSDQGIGVFDAHAVRFLDFLQQAGLKYWQICPLGPTGYGDSPYQCFSAFAGNPYLIDLRALVAPGLLEADALLPLTKLSTAQVDYEALHRIKLPLLQQAFANYQSLQPALPYGDFAEFKRTHAAWLDAYTLYRALKDHFDGRSWTEWPLAERTYTTAVKSPLRARLATQIEEHAFTQYLFFGQWELIRTAARDRGIEIIGDIPIFIALDSSDAWANPGLFELDPKTLQPTAVAGVPPDYFSVDGQLWGNPLYTWQTHRNDDYRWWKERLGAAFALYDVVRIDHFRGFDTYWSIPLPAENARRGTWLPGPGLELFRSFHGAFPKARIIAEDLGDLTESVHELRRQTGLPGMLVLQFAFGDTAQNGYLPHHATPNSVIYPGTHDNDTTRGWYGTASAKERDFARRYLRISGDEIAWDFIRAAYACASRLAIFSLQDVFSLGSDARFNTPGKPTGNWQWRYTSAQLDEQFPSTAAYLQELAQLYAR